jgi:hypothetical protein
MSTLLYYLYQFIHFAIIITILVFVILIYQNIKHTENFDNCFGIQYNGLPLIDNPKLPLCSKNTTKPLYPEGGCAVYNPEKISQEYAEGKFTSAV